MKIFDKFKKYLKEINDFEYNISNNRQDLLEVYQRNIVLEKEIEERTQELNLANKTLLTLQHIWDMMNSTTPLSNVLEKVVQSLHGEFGYLYGVILKKEEVNEEKYWLTTAFTQGNFFAKIKEIYDTDVKNLKLHYNEQTILVSSLQNGVIAHTKDVKGFISSFLKDSDTNTCLTKILEEEGVKSVIILPMKPENEEFGCMLILSPRKEVSDNELNFLNLFAHQMKLSITIVGLFEKVKKQALTDPLTDLYNRRYFEESIIKEAERSERLNQPFTLISLDLDFLKKINDKYGHNYGDIAIKTVGKILKRNARSIDIPARIGGEEFNVILPGIDSQGGLIAAERIRSSIEAEELDIIGNITASIGVATYLEHTKSTDELLEIADQAMYKAKIDGRNQVVLAKTYIRESWQQTAIDAFLDILLKQRIPVSKELSEELRTKLDRITTAGATVKEILYSIVDMLSQTYNPIHSEGITKMKVSLGVKLARLLELPKEDIDNLKLAILLYDIGNTMIPENILQKPDELSPKEIAVVKKHPLIAAKDILKPISAISEVIPIIEHHHENWDGTGYPSKIKGNEIPVVSQIVLLIDSYTALIQKRSYRSAMTPNQALEVIEKDSGKKWNPKLVEQFIFMMDSEAER